MAKIAAFSINCMDRGWGSGKKAQNQSSPHVVGSEKIIVLTMMLSKGPKVAIERVQATPLRWPLASSHLGVSFQPSNVREDCFII